MVCNLQQLIEQKQFCHYQQTIHSIHHNKHLGSEFLLRSSHGNPEEIFSIAKKEQRLFDLDTLSIQQVLHSIYTTDFFKKAGLLFINIFPSTILHPMFPAFLKKIASYFPNSFQHVVFELNESEMLDDLDGLIERIYFIKSYGYKVAIDDVGKGWSSLNLIVEYPPEFMKLDRIFASNLATSERKQTMVRSLLDFCNKNEIQLILEGIETKKDLEIAKQIGIQWCQGYHLSRPTAFQDEC